jgi:chromosome segregation ATPase
MSNAFQILQEEQKRRSAEWKRIRTRLTADVESTFEENGRLKQAIASLTGEAAKLKDEKDGAVRRARQFQDELGLLKMELAVTKKDVRMARSVSNERQKEVDQLRDELGKKQYLAQANLKRIVDKFQEKTKAEIEVATAMALQSWSE